MSLLRLVLVVGCTVSFLATSTAPARSAGSERVNPSSNELVMGMIMKTVLIPKIIYLSFSIIEVISTISFYLPEERIPLLVQSLRGPYPPEPPSAFFVLISILCMLGGLLRVICYRTLGELFTFNLSLRKSHVLITTGPYAYVRHPSYIGAMMVVIPLIVMHLLPESWVQSSGLLAVPMMRIALGIWWMYGVVGVVGAFRRIADEDKLLKQTFGKEWENWAARVKYRLIPGVY